MQATISNRAKQLIINAEVISPDYYRKHFTHPIWPGGESGITIGIGYDLGYNTQQQIREDWMTLLAPSVIEKLCSVTSVKGMMAKTQLHLVSDVDVPYEAAEHVFLKNSLPRYASLTNHAFPGYTKLPADAQGALISLVYNRGSKVDDSDRRKEMKAIRGMLSDDADLNKIAEQLREMKRLWGKGLEGLKIRREKEAQLVETANRTYTAEDLVTIAFA